MLDAQSYLVFIAGAIGAASVYVFFGPSPTYTKRTNSKNAPIRGLQNVKNNCFINSILQSIASSDSMVTWLSCANITTKSNGKLILQLSNIVNKINQNNDWYEILTPQLVLQALSEHRWVFSNEEQDAYELYNDITATLEKELKHFSFLYSIRNIFSDEKDTLLQSSSSHIIKNYTISTRATGKTTVPSHLNNTLPTRGILANHLICRNCHYKYPLHLDVFDAITLNLPYNSLGSSILLEQCLSKFVRSELIDDFMCETCSQKTTFDKKVEFIKLPKLLCFHIQRLVWSAGEMPVKRFDHVLFPEHLEMDPYTYKYQTDLSHISGGSFGLIGGKNPLSENDSLNISNPASNSDSHSVLSDLPKPKLVRYKYMLNSVIAHLGNSSSGHFICYRRKYDSLSKRLKWFYTSDLAVKEVSQREVFSCPAYMLFYERNNERLM